jgi:hypothetical protein
VPVESHPIIDIEERDLRKPGTEERSIFDFGDVQVLGAQKLLQLPQYPGQETPGELLKLGVLVLLTMLIPMMLLLLTFRVSLLIPGLLLIALPVVHVLHVHVAALQIDVHPTFVRLSVVLKAKFLAYLLDTRLDLLDVAWAVVPFSHDNVQMRLPRTPGVLDSLFENVFRLLDELAVQVYRVSWDATGRVVLAEDELGSLSVILLHFGAVLFALLGECVRCGAIPAGISLL